ncbi:MAG: hypothetical protein V4801_32535 [Burkholderia gladioli]
MVLLLRAMDEAIRFPFFALEDEAAVLMAECGGVALRKRVYRLEDEEGADALMARVTAACLCGRKIAIVRITGRAA